MSDLDFAADHFALFGLPRSQQLDSAALDLRFRQLQTEVHPDRHVQAGDAGQRLSMQWASRVNEAYQTLKNPLRRALYLLQLTGHDPQVENNTAMPADFLFRQMELRESVAEARRDGDEGVLEAARLQLVQEIAAVHRRLIELMDGEHEYVAASGLVRQLMFQEKLLGEIDDALEVVAS
ncbi:MAG: Fe-S protein assembly co-chaperone HscB [Betaproteobacteria bacterium HGW-Betaproteobacteria-11]|nr:MAG: Fe-S protein assembly co-chaperone HscB [Betaproteobacteria bacterium HGW-Betaproteobacteria-11]